MGDIITNIEQGMASSSADTTKIVSTGANILKIINIFGVVIAVGVIMVLGIKYMMGSASEKAEYKKTMIPYIIGAVLLAASTTIANVIFGFANTLK